MATSDRIKERIEVFARELSEALGEVDESLGGLLAGCRREPVARNWRCVACPATEAEVDRSASGRRGGVPAVRQGGPLSREAGAGTRYPPRAGDHRRTGVLLPRLSAGFFSR